MFLVNFYYSDVTGRSKNSTNLWGCGKLKLINNQNNELTFNANNELEKLNILRQHYGDLLQKAVEEPVVETVTKEVK